MGAPQPTLAEVNRKIALLENLRDALMEQERVNDAVASAAAEMEWFMVHPLDPKPTGTSNSQLYQDVLLAHGRPMHVRKLTEAALARGARLRGEGKPMDQVRSSVSNSKRFVNIGSNVWWVADHPIPDDDEALENGKNRSCE